MSSSIILIPWTSLTIAGNFRFCRRVWRPDHCVSTTRAAELSLPTKNSLHLPTFAETK